MFERLPFSDGLCSMVFYFSFKKIVINNFLLMTGTSFRFVIWFCGNDSSTLHVDTWTDVMIMLHTKEIWSKCVMR